MRKFVVAAIVATAAVGLVALNLWNRQRPPAPTSGPFTQAERLAQIGPPARERLRPAFEKARLEYPPAQLLLVAFKHERTLELYASSTADSPPVFLTRYPILGASGYLGPKLREGDRQVPEGLYRLQAFNPNSRFHVSIRVDYPNEFDLARAERDGRDQPGTDIFIHGSDLSIGCLAVGDIPAEDLFVLAADTGLENTELLIAPYDYRDATPAPRVDAPFWMNPVYDELRARITALPPPPGVNNMARSSDRRSPP
ncbi:MAG: hypothetical protein WA771_15580 [Chthoniobacterales bacterium]